MANGDSRISRLGLLPLKGQEEDDADGEANCSSPEGGGALSNAAFEPSVANGGDEGERDAEESFKAEKRSKWRRSIPRDESAVGEEGLESRNEARNRSATVEIFGDPPGNGKEGSARGVKKRSSDAISSPAETTLGAQSATCSRSSESPYRRKTGASSVIRRKRVEDSKRSSSFPATAWCSPREATSPSPASRDSASGSLRPSRRSSGPRCQEAISSILWEPYDCRRRRQTLVAGSERYTLHGMVVPPTIYYQAPPHPFLDYALWVPPPPSYETLLSSSSSSSLSSTSSSSFLCCPSNGNRMSEDVATARRVLEKAERAAEEATEAALRGVRSFQYLPPEGNYVAIAPDSSRLPPISSTCFSLGEAKRESADLAGERNSCPYCLSRPPEASRSSSGDGRLSCRCECESVECSSRCVSVRALESLPPPTEVGWRRRRRDKLRRKGGDRCTSGNNTPDTEMVSVSVEGALSSSDEEAPPTEGAGGDRCVGSVAAVGDASSALVDVVNVVSCLRVPVPGAQRCDFDGKANVSNVRVSTEAQERTFASTEAQTDVTGGAAIRRIDDSVTGRRHREDRERRRRERRHRRTSTANQPPPPIPHNPPPPGDVHWQTTRLEGVTVPCGVVVGAERMLPDILNSHLPPPYSTLPMSPPSSPPRLVVPIVGAPPPPPPLPGGPPMIPVSPPPPLGGMTYPTPPGRRCRMGHTTRGGNNNTTQFASDEDGPPKSCCGLSAGALGVGEGGHPAASVRWFVLAIAFVGVCCALVGTVLGALKATGREHLTVSLLMIGVGIVLITVSGVAWRLTSHEAPSCRMMLGLGSSSDEGAAPNRRFVPRLPPSYGRPHHPYAAMMYPEFQYRPPPPSYQASMQEYRLRLLLMDRHPGALVTTGGSGGGLSIGMIPPPHHRSPLNNPRHAVSPPPTYRSYAGSTIREWRCRAGLGFRRSTDAQEQSRPPSYRSRASSSVHDHPTLDPRATAAAPGGIGNLENASSLTFISSPAASHQDSPEIRSVSVNPCDVSVVNVNTSSIPSSPIPNSLVLMMVAAATTTGHEDKKVAIEPSMLLCSEDKDLAEPDDDHLVTIVQTTNSESCDPRVHEEHRQQHQHCARDSVIVTVSGSTTNEMISRHSGSPTNGEIEILAHL